MNDFFQMFKEELNLLKKLKKQNKKPNSTNVSTIEDKSLQTNQSKNTFNTKSDYSLNSKTNSSKKISQNSKTINPTPLSNHDFNSVKSSSITSSASSGGGSGSLSFGSSVTNSNTHSKGGVVVNNQSVVVKTNFEMAGRLNTKGKRPNSKEVGSHASASLSYMDNHGARDLEENDTLSNTYHENGDRMSKEEFKDLQNDLKEGTQAFRRVVVDVGQKEFDREDLNKLIREGMQEFKEHTGKDLEYKFAIHTDTESLHAHITAFGSNADINFTKDHLQDFKEIIGEKSQEILLEKSLEHDKDLSLNQQIDKELDGILDQKIENDFTQDQEQSKGLSL